MEKRRVGQGEKTEKGVPESRSEMVQVHYEVYKEKLCVLKIDRYVFFRVNTDTDY